MNFIINKRISGTSSSVSSVCTFVTKPGARVKVPTQSSKLYFGEVLVRVSKDSEITVPEIAPGKYIISDDSKH